MAPHLMLKMGQIRPFVIVVGDPFRCDEVTNMCEKSEQIAWNREYRSFNITYQGVELSLVSHGVGGPGAAICFEELIKLGVTCMIRLGTCGALKDEFIEKGDLIVSTGASAEDGYSQFLAP